MEASLPSGGQQKERMLGIELFRVVAMYLIVLLHILGQGGVYPHASYMSVNYKIAWYLETLGYCAVNCYALISGYVGIRTSFRFRRIFLLWLEVFFITVSTTAIYALVSPESVDADKWLIALFPLTRREYWYFNAYVILFPFLPVLNRGISALGKWLHGRILLYLFVLTTILPILGDRDIFSLSWGYSGLWLAVMYLFGAYYRLYGLPRIGRVVCAVGFFGCGALAWGFKIGVQEAALRGVLSTESALFARAGDLIEYTSPLMVVMSLCLLWIFARVKIRTRPIAFLVKWLGASSFGVFLVHVGTMVWGSLAGRFAFLAELSPIAMTLGVLGASAAVYLACTVYSLMRIGIFKLCRVRRIVDGLADKYFSKPLEIEEKK